MVQALGRHGWLHLEPPVLGCLHPLVVAITKRRCFHVVFKNKVFFSFGVQMTAMLPQLPGGFPARGRAL